MRSAILLLPVLGIVAACNGEVSLPQDPVKKAMTCALGASFILAPKVQAAKDGNIPSDDYAPTFYYSDRLAAAEGKPGYLGYVAALKEVGAKAGEDNEVYASDGYQAACRKAYPAVDAKEIQLAVDDETAAQQCIAMARFAPSAVEGAVSDADAIKAQGAAIMAGTRAIMTKVAERQNMDENSDYDAYFDKQFAKVSAMAPFTVAMDTCEKRFGGKPAA
jgi:hypothetical protein